MVLYRGLRATRNKTHPQLTIKGRWLEQIRFYVGCPVIIKIEQGKLIIELEVSLKSNKSPAV
ncbi:MULTISPECIES: SymE family type I addiction module toxin [unclassified Gilliamella]|uniref:SymE family type I addiction module toxin n=1 Tax=unclassified Gilliamella TaxID=2685620 RepID=UPI002A0FB018|nr:SymE family type I addiction module toxin [Gilliamella sp. B3722]MCX8607759.1 SymE family type I addiction module toxin [Gilliamella sp. B3771]MCX8609983.1 SymE family type I addiction module toxin [Gilliamella sp. B3891]MCX8611927.1 SymE family type I addiction module toxin [Gilliamella sp. B3773]MCX8615952.1 SymE family type I addiction module toxin [Gilliamella sp. B3770]MCX8619688.1 SymE family type I addiction module toxin [Gilliamella sp. B3892]MCX8622133.1 SymE family type I addicti